MSIADDTESATVPSTSTEEVEANVDGALLKAIKTKPGTPVFKT